MQKKNVNEIKNRKINYFGANLPENKFKFELSLADFINSCSNSVSSPWEWRANILIVFNNHIILVLLKPS